MNYLIWILSIIVVMIISAFIHEIGHGIAAKLQGIQVSTGFNRVGDVRKKPSDGDFRSEVILKDIKYDFGVPITLLLAIIFTYLTVFTTVESKLFIFGIVAIVNSLLRLIPMTLSLIKLITTGNLGIEDEVSLGNKWVELTGMKFFKLLPIMISIIVSIICYYYSVRSFSTSQAYRTIGNYGYVTVIIISYILGMNILNALDEKYRINWK